MAHYKHKKCRAHHSGKYSKRALRERFGDTRWLGWCPRWWDKLFHTRAARRWNNAMQHEVLRGADPDCAEWRDSRKPAEYYW